MNHWELDSEQLRRTGWAAIWNDVKNKIRDEAGRLRRVRSLLPLFGDQTTDPDAIVDYRTNQIDGARPVISIDPSRQRLVSAELRAEFRLALEQYGDDGVAMALVSRAASRIGAAEDGLLLHGDDAGPALAALNVAHRNLDKQDSRLFPAGVKTVNGPILDFIARRRSIPLSFTSMPRAPSAIFSNAVARSRMYGFSAQSLIQSSSRSCSYVSSSIKVRDILTSLII